MADAAPPRLARLAHELRTPLAAIAGLAQIMQSGRLGPLPPAYAEYAQLISAGADHAMALVESLPSDTPDPPQPLAAVAAEAVSLVRSAGDVHVDIAMDLTREAGEWPAPSRAMRQILINLLDNAIRATASSGAVTMSASTDFRGLRVVVCDSGGRTPVAGAGHGLSIVRMMIASLGGEFDLKLSAAGAEAVLRLPAPPGP